MANDQVELLNNLIKRDAEGTAIDPLAQAKAQAQQQLQVQAAQTQVQNASLLNKYAKDAQDLNQRALDKQKKIDLKLAGKTAADRAQLLHEQELYRELGATAYLRDPVANERSTYSSDMKEALVRRMQEEEQQRLYRRYAPTTLGEDITDLGTSIGSGLLDAGAGTAGLVGALGAGAANVVDWASQALPEGYQTDLRDEDSPIFDNFASRALAKGAEGLRGFQSDALKQENQDVQNALAATQAKVDYLEEQGIPVDSIKRIYDDAGTAASGMSLWGFVNLIAEELPGMLTAGKAGSTIVEKSIKELASKAGDKSRDIARKAMTGGALNQTTAALREKGYDLTAKALDKIASPTGKLGAAIEMGANEVISEASLELAKAEDMGYKNYIEANDVLAQKFKEANPIRIGEPTEEEYRQFVVAEHDKNTAAKLGVAIAASTLTGAASKVTDVTKGKTVGAIGATVSEAAEEGLQEYGFGKVDQTMKDTTVDPTARVGQSIAEGSAVGGSLAATSKVAEFRDESKLDAAQKKQTTEQVEKTAKGNITDKEELQKIKDNMFKSSDKELIKQSKGNPNTLPATMQQMEKQGITFTSDEKARVGRVQDKITQSNVAYAEKLAKTKADADAFREMSTDKTSALAGGTIGSDKLSTADSITNLNHTTESIIGNQIGDGTEDSPVILGSSPEALAAKNANKNFINNKTTSNQAMTEYASYNPQGLARMEAIHQEKHQNITNWTASAVNAIMEGDVDQLKSVIIAANDMLARDEQTKKKGNPKTGKPHTPRYLKLLNAEIDYVGSLKDYIEKNAALSDNEAIRNIDMAQSTGVSTKDPLEGVQKPPIEKLIQDDDFVSVNRTGQTDLLKLANTDDMVTSLRDDGVVISNESMEVLNNLGKKGDERPSDKAVKAAYREINDAIKQNPDIKDIDGKQINSLAGYINSKDPDALKNFDEKNIFIGTQAKDSAEDLLAKDEAGVREYSKVEPIDVNEDVAGIKVHQDRTNLEDAAKGSLGITEAEISDPSTIDTGTTEGLNKQVVAESIKLARQTGIRANKQDQVDAYNKLADVINTYQVPTKVSKSTKRKPLTATPNLNVTKNGILRNLSQTVRDYLNVGKGAVANNIPHLFGSFLNKDQDSFKLATNGLSDKQQDQLLKILKAFKSPVRNYVDNFKSKPFKNHISQEVEGTSSLLPQENGIPVSITGSLTHVVDSKGNPVTVNNENLMDQIGMATLGALTTGTLAADINKSLRLLSKDSGAKTQTKEQLEASFDSATKNKIGQSIPATILAEDLGKAIMKSMGLRASDNAPNTYQNHLEQALGNIAINVLMDAGILNEKKINVAVDFKDGFHKLNNEATGTIFLSANNASEILADLRNADLNQFFQQFTGSIKDPNGVPTEAPTTFSDKMTKGKLSKDHELAIKNSRETPRKLFTNMAQTLVNTFTADEKTFFKILGIDENTELEMDTEGNNAKRDDIRKVIETLKKVLDNPDEYEEIYQEYVLGKNGRLTEVSGLSPQANKLVRSIVNAHQDSTTDINDVEQVHNWKMGISRLFDEDKLGLGETLGWFSYTFQLDNFNGDLNTLSENALIAYEAYQKISKGEPVNDPRLLDLVHKGGLHAETLAGIYSIGAFINAKVTNEPVFQNHIFREDDGIANGVYFLLTQFGNFSSIEDLKESMIQVGVTIGDGEDVIDLRNSPDFTDVYQSLGASVMEHVNELRSLLDDESFVGHLTQKGQPETVDQIKLVMGSIFEPKKLKKVIRNIMKYPLMTYIYGAGDKSIKNLMHTDFTELMLDKVRDLQERVLTEIDNGEKNPTKSTWYKEKIIELQNQLNAIANIYGVSDEGQLQLNTTDKPRFKIEFNPTNRKLEIEYTYSYKQKQEKGKDIPKTGTKKIENVNDLKEKLARGIDVLVGQPAIDSINKKYHKVSAQAKLFSDTVNLMSRMYVDDFNARADTIMAQSKKPYLTKGEQQSIVDELAELYPAIGTLMSSGEGKDLLSGLHITKQEFSRDTDKAHTQHKELTPSNQTKSGLSTSISTAETTLTAVSTPTNPYIGHLLDSGVIAKMLMDKPDLLQVYDGIAQDVNTTKGTELANIAAKESIDYSPIEAVSKALQQTIQYREDAGYTPTSLVQAVGTARGNVKLTPNQLVQLTAKMAEASDLYKDKLKATMQIVNQYGNYKGGLFNANALNDDKALNEVVLTSQIPHTILEHMVVNSITEGKGTPPVNEAEFDRIMDTELSELLTLMQVNQASQPTPEDIAKAETLKENQSRTIEGNDFVISMVPNEVALSQKQASRMLDKDATANDITAAINTMDKVLKQFSVNRNIVPFNAKEPLAGYFGDIDAVAAFMEKYGSELLQRIENDPVRDNILTVQDVYSVFENTPELKDRIKKGRHNSTLGSSPESFNTIDDVNLITEGLLKDLDMSDLGDRLHANDPNNHLISSEHSNALDNIIGSLSELYNVTKTAISIRTGKLPNNELSVGQVDTANNSIVLGVAGKRSHRVGTTAKEALAHELTHPVWKWAITNNPETGYLKELTGIINDFRKGLAKDGIDPTKIFLEGIDNPTPEEVKRAKALADYTLGLDGTSLDEFAAYAMTNESFRKALVNYNRSAEVRTNTFLNRMRELFNKILAVLGSKAYIAGSEGKSLDKAMDKLFNDINRAYKDSRATVANQTKAQVLAGKSMAGINKGLDKADKALKAGTLAAITTLAGGTAQAGINMYDALEDVPVEATQKFSKTFRETLNQTFGDIIPMELSDNLTQLMGNRIDVARANQTLSRATAFVDSASNKVKTSLFKHLQGLAPKEFTDIKATAIRNGVLRADLPALLNTYGLDDIVDMYGSLAEVDRVLVDSANDIKAEFGLNVSRAAVRVTQAFGGFQVNGKSKYGTFLQNHHVAAKVLAKELDIPDNKVDKLAEMLDQMMTIQVIKETHAVGMAGTIYSELTDPTMTEYYANLIEAAKGHHEHSKELFKSSENIMVKGYIQDVTNPNVSVVHQGLHEKENLENQGYKLIETLPTMTGKPIGTFVRNFGGSTYTATSSLKRSSNEAAGSGMSDVLGMTLSGMEDAGLAAVIDSNKTLANDLSNEIKHYAAGRNYSPATVKHNMVPLPSADGSVYRFRARLIDDEFKKKHLGLYNDPSAALANSMGTLSYKVNTPKSNREVITNLYNTYKKEYSKYPNSFIEINVNNLKDPKNKRFARAYTALDNESKQFLNDVYGNTGKIYVKRNQYTQVFGYDRFSVDDIRKKVLPEINTLDNMLRVVNNTMVPFINNRITKTFEYYGQEYVKEILKSIVVKTGTVTLGNFASNLGLTLMMGMNPVTTGKDVIEGIRLGKEFISDLDELSELEAKLLSTPNDRLAERSMLDKRIQLLKEQMKRSPMYDLYLDGHINHVVTDPEHDLTQLNTPKSKLREFANEKYFNRVDSKLSDATKELLALEDSMLYGFMQQSVMMSDLGYKYAYKKHLESRGENKRDALDKVSYVFLNYDAPSSKGVDYLESLGLMMFTKFNLRFQRAITVTFANSPTRTILTYMGMDQIAPQWNIGDSSYLTGTDMTDVLSNPFSNLTTPITATPLGTIFGTFN